MPQHEPEQDGPVHVVGSSVNLPDMSAHLAAKVSVSHDQQADPSRLAAIYDDMAAKFQRHGLTIPAVQAVRQYFTNLEGTGKPVDTAASVEPDNAHTCSLPGHVAFPPCARLYNTQTT